MSTSSLRYSPEVLELPNSRANAPYTVLCGANNSGKSLLLKSMKLRRGRDAYLVGPQRFYHVAELATQRFNDMDYQSWDQQFRQNSSNPEFNFEQNYIDLGRILGALKDVRRNKLFDLCGKLLGCTFSLKRRDPDNELTPRFVDMDGQNLAVGSTGTRLLLTLLGLCMDEKFNTLLIDEPELGLSPKIQLVLGKFLANAAERNEYFPHLKQIYIATHSHLFLDRANLSNNFVVSKTEDLISVRQLSSVMELHDLQFNLLGNSLEALFLPSAIVLVEGKTDKPYLSRLMQLRFPGRNVLVIEGQGDVKRIFYNLCTSLGDIQKSPFRPRIFVVLDKVYSHGTVAELQMMGALKENIITWTRNGIEFLYPSSIMQEIFSCAAWDLENLQLDDDNITLNGITKRKVGLCDEVIAGLTADTVLPEELQKKLIDGLKTAIGE